MISLLPTKQQWRTWSKPTKYEFIGLVIAVLALVDAPGIISRATEAAPSRDYDTERIKFVNKLQSANLCLASRLYFDGMHRLESNCRLDLSGLTQFARDFAPLMATAPYSGAWNLEEYAEEVERAADSINASASRAQLITQQRNSRLSIAQVGYYICGLEWYLRGAPPSPLAPMQEQRVKLYQAAWTSWNEDTKAKFNTVPFELTAEGNPDDEDCSSFIDLLD